MLAPKHLSFDEMAGLPGAGGTAMNALFYGPQPLVAGMTILTQGTGGVIAHAMQVRITEPAAIHI